MIFKWVLEMILIHVNMGNSYTSKSSHLIDWVSFTCLFLITWRTLQSSFAV